MNSGLFYNKLDHQPEEIDRICLGRAIDRSEGECFNAGDRSDVQDGSKALIIWQSGIIGCMYK